MKIEVENWSKYDAVKIRGKLMKVIVEDLKVIVDYLKVIMEYILRDEI